MPNRTMIIVWRWKKLTSDNQDIVAIKNSETDKIIRIIEKKSDTAKENIYALIGEYSKKGHVFIFLHRGHNYLESDIHDFLSKKNSSNFLLKCFLFSEGRDFLYYKNDYNGLIDENGNFYFEHDYPIKYINDDGEEQIRYDYFSILEKDDITNHFQVKFRYFDRTWRYYEHEFLKKIQELYVDLICTLVHIPNNRNNEIPQSYTNWNNILTKPRNTILLYRLKDFLDLYEQGYLNNLNTRERFKNTNEWNELKDYEEEEGVSYVFDDVHANLKENKEIHDAYETLKSKLIPILSKKEEGKISLRDIEKSFSNLLLNMQNTLS